MGGWVGGGWWSKIAGRPEYPPYPPQCHQSNPLNRQELPHTVLPTAFRTAPDTHTPRAMRCALPPLQDSDGVFTVQEFMGSEYALLMTKPFEAQAMAKKREEGLRAAFAAIDTDGSGHLDKAELRSVIRRIHPNHPDRVCVCVCVCVCPRRFGGPIPVALVPGRSPIAPPPPRRRAAFVFLCAEARPALSVGRRRLHGGKVGGQTVKRPQQQTAHPQYANWALLTRKRHIPPHSAQPQYANRWAPRTRKGHQQEHRPQRPPERSDPTQHAEGRTGGCPGPRKGTTTRGNVTQGGGGAAVPMATPRGKSCR